MGDSNIKPVSSLRAAKGKQNLKKRRVNKRPGSNQRRRTKAAEARQVLDHLLASMSPDERRAVLKEIADDDDEGMMDDAKVTGDATKENEEPISDASKEIQ